MFWKEAPPIRPISTVPSCKPSIMAVSVPSWELGNTLISTRPWVAALTSSAKPEAATCQLWAGGSTWPSFSVAACAGKAERANAIPSNSEVFDTLMGGPPCAFPSLGDALDARYSLRQPRFIHGQCRAEVALSMGAEARAGRHDDARLIEE